MSEPTPRSRYAALFWSIVIAGLILFNLVFFFGPDMSDPATAMRVRHDFDYRHWPGWYSVNLWLLALGLSFVLVLKTTKARRFFHAIYASEFWMTGLQELQSSRLNRRFVSWMLRRKYGKRLLCRWIRFWRGLRVEQYDRYMLHMTILAVLLVTLCYSRWLAPVRVFFLYRTARLRHFLVHDLYEAFYLTPLTQYFIDGQVGWRLVIAPVTGLLIIAALVVMTIRRRKRRSHERS